MRAHIKLMGALRNKLPAGSAASVAQVDLANGASVATALEKLGIAASAVHLVMVNGEMEANRARPLADGDELVVFPPVAGG